MKQLGRTLSVALYLGAPLSACSPNPETAPELADAAVRIDRSTNELFITRENHILWNGQRVSLGQLARLLKKTSILSPEPELSFRPDAEASYDMSAKVLQIMKNSGATKFGFVGNEAYSTSDKPAD